MTTTEELQKLIQELGAKDLKYTISPKSDINNAEELEKSIIYMLKIYKRYLEGDESAPIRRIDKYLENSDKLERAIKSFSKHIQNLSPEEIEERLSKFPVQNYEDTYKL